LFIFETQLHYPDYCREKEFLLTLKLEGEEKRLTVVVGFQNIIMIAPGASAP
jgi:hypothetical protein